MSIVIFHSRRIDKDAKAFISAAQLTNATHKKAVNKLVKDLKGIGVWSKMKAVYPLVGGTSSSHKWNLKDPRDLDAAFRLQFTGSPTHNSNGIEWTTTTQYADTKLTPQGVLSLNSTHISYYSRHNISGAYSDMGVETGANTNLQLLIDYSGTTYYNNNDYTFTGVAGLVPDTKGLFISNRQSSTTRSLSRNGNTISTQSATTVSLPTTSIWIGKRNGGGALNSTARGCAFASVGDGLTDAESLAFYQSIQTFQGILGRAV